MKAPTFDLLAILAGAAAVVCGTPVLPHDHFVPLTPSSAHHDLASNVQHPHHDQTPWPALELNRDAVQRDEEHFWKSVFGTSSQFKHVNQGDRVIPLLPSTLAKVNAHDSFDPSEFLNVGPSSPGKQMTPSLPPPRSSILIQSAGSSSGPDRHKEQEEGQSQHRHLRPLLSEEELRNRPPRFNTHSWMHRLHVFEIERIYHTLAVEGQWVGEMPESSRHKAIARVKEELNDDLADKILSGDIWTARYLGRKTGPKYERHQKAPLSNYQIISGYPADLSTRPYRYRQFEWQRKLEVAEIERIYHTIRPHWDTTRPKRTLSTALDRLKRELEKKPQYVRLILGGNRFEIESLAKDLGPQLPQKTSTVRKRIATLQRKNSSA